ncbi:hypothetical protein [Priestia koreensis]|uniref:hypothetical protein n=1 Tax=Priestia koreensis TaxID=284581 RepID=UPI0034594F1E
MLFHYHFWTPYVEETEKFYESLGFSVVQRIGRVEGTFQTFDPPLQWEDFRNHAIQFRIIEMRKDKINITFGYGKRVLFDHIGFFVSKEEHDHIVVKANNLHWKSEIDERRTFIQTPYRFRIELQTRQEMIEDGSCSLQGITITSSAGDLKTSLSSLLGELSTTIEQAAGEKTMLTLARMTGVTASVDPNGVVIHPS